MKHSTVVFTIVYLTVMGVATFENYYTRNGLHGRAPDDWGLYRRDVFWSPLDNRDLTKEKVYNHNTRRGNIQGRGLDTTRHHSRETGDHIVHMRKRDAEPYAASIDDMALVTDASHLTKRGNFLPKVASYHPTEKKNRPSTLELAGGGQQRASHEEGRQSPVSDTGSLESLSSAELPGTFQRHPSHVATCVRGVPDFCQDLHYGKPGRRIGYCPPGGGYTVTNSELFGVCYPLCRCVGREEFEKERAAKGKQQGMNTRVEKETQTEHGKGKSSANKHGLNRRYPDAEPEPDPMMTQPIDQQQVESFYNAINRQRYFAPGQSKIYEVVCPKQIKEQCLDIQYMQVKRGHNGIAYCSESGEYEIHELYGKGDPRNTKKSDCAGCRCMDKWSIHMVRVARKKGETSGNKHGQQSRQDEPGPSKEEQESEGTRGQRGRHGESSQSKEEQEGGDKRRKNNQGASTSQPGRQSETHHKSKEKDPEWVPTRSRTSARGRRQQPNE